MTMLRGGNLLPSAQGVEKVQATPYDVKDLDLELELGLSTMQEGRILHLVEEAYQQNPLLIR